MKKLTLAVWRQGGKTYEIKVGKDPIFGEVLFIGESQGNTGGRKEPGV